jgi:peptidoglycan/xylan/chitin deacetylase (PgdA/CDA1 family)
MKPPYGVTSVAITIDDGFCPNCVAAYVDFAESSGTPITFSPNGAYRAMWEPHASKLRTLIAAGQVQIGNHTWTHKRLIGRASSDIEADIRRNEEWIQEVFGITARPWFRPPYGMHNKHSDAVAAGVGYTHIVLWNGTFGDGTAISADQLMSLADRYLKAGTIMLGHANHPTVTELFPQLLEIIQARNLQPVTLDTMFGTSRTTG